MLLDARQRQRAASLPPPGPVPRSARSPPSAVHGRQPLRVQTRYQSPPPGAAANMLSAPNCPVMPTVAAGLDAIWPPRDCQRVHPVAVRRLTHTALSVPRPNTASSGSGATVPGVVTVAPGPPMQPAEGDRRRRRVGHGLQVDGCVGAGVGEVCSTAGPLLVTTPDAALIVTPCARPGASCGAAWAPPLAAAVRLPLIRAAVSSATALGVHLLANGPEGPVVVSVRIASSPSPGFIRGRMWRRHPRRHSDCGLTFTFCYRPHNGPNVPFRRDECGPSGRGAHLHA